VKSLSEQLSSETKEKISNIFIINFDLINLTAINVLNYYRETKTIANTDGTSIAPVTSVYLHFLDILLITFINKNSNFKSILQLNSTSIYNNLISNFLFYSNNTFLQTRILKILVITLNNEFYKEFISEVVNNENIIKYIENSNNFKDIIDFEKLILKNKVNLQFIFKLLNNYNSIVRCSETNSTSNT